MPIICLYCCGGIGKEIADLLNTYQKFESLVFVDDDEEKSGKTINGINVYTLNDCLKKFEFDKLRFIITSGEPKFRESLSAKIEQNRLAQINFYPPGFYFSKNSTIGIGTIVHLGATITTNVIIGKCCLINKNAVIAHDVNIDEFCVISPNVTIGGNVSIGKNCFIGSGAIIRNGLTIGKNSIIGMGSVVLENVADNSVVVGNPAKFLRKNESRRVFP